MRCISERAGHAKTYLLRFDRDEELIEGLKDFCRSRKIAGGCFSCIGASKLLTLSWFDPAKKKYHDKAFKAPLEIVSMSGNISVFNEELVIHAHGVFSDRAMRAFGGHVKKLIVSATCEAIVWPLGASLRRAFSKEVGLRLLDGVFPQ